MIDTHEPEDAITKHIQNLKDLFGEENGARYAKAFGFTDPVIIPPTPTAPTEIDPTTPALPEGRYRGVLRWHSTYGYITPQTGNRIGDYRTTPMHIVGGVSQLKRYTPYAVEFSAGEDMIMGYLTARLVVLVDNPASIAAYANRKPHTPRQHPPRSLAEHIARKTERTETRTPIEGVYVDKAKLLNPGSAEHEAWRDSIPADANTQVVVRTSEGYEIDEHPNLIDLDF